MTFRSTLAIWAGKSTAWFLSTFLSRGSTLPGKIALAFDPHLLSHLAKNMEIIVITGTNGKTLTTALTVGILEESVGPVITNESGANMMTGILSTFLKAAKLKPGEKQFAVLEIDEASLPDITQHIHPSLFVLTNIFRDQMDRYGEIYTTYQLILDGIKNAPEATILLNGDSPIFHSPDLPNSKFYYGFDQEIHAPRRAHYNTEGVLCPRCHHILDFKMNTYANLGNYICPNCGLSRPDLDYRLTKLTALTNTSAEFIIDDYTYKINVGGLYNIYNALAAVSVAEFYKLSHQAIKDGFDKSRAVFGRQETFEVSKKSVTIVLIKNPVGANQALDMMGLAPYPFSLIALLNANYADGIDTSWIWDANFESLTEMAIDQVITGGVRSNEMARRLQVAGLDPIQEMKTLNDVLKAIKDAPSDHVYILATYTAMLEMRDLLASHKLITKEMA